MAKTITVRLDDSVYEIIKMAADGDKRTISNFMEYATVQYIINTNIADDEEMNEIKSFEKDIKRGLTDIERGRYKIVGRI
ncbi:CopG family transcriptional regulator [Brucepastera parasyntrophica]|uniref:CopG family transcriptional regulator n=1 Tax=Brucepastera parasyntrophica TaxID=2880008 RepID=UPI00210C3225|nr:CopG family transcriptional regulator [Brucepastera parasyntrophica]ULQ58578.1 CopG family transcriptional regulator [Brucepastera parasyntrophica]